MKAAPLVSWQLRSGAPIGIGTGPGALMVGASLAAMVSPAWLFVVIPVGSLLAAGLCGAQGWRGLRERASALEIATGVFGRGTGPDLLALLIGAGMAGWAGFYLGVVAGAVEEVIGWSPWLVAPAVGLGLWLVHSAGMSAWNIFVFGTALCALLVAVVIVASVPAGLEPAEVSDGATGVILALGLCISYTSLFLVRAADFSWDLRSTRDAVMQGVVLFSALVLFLSLGAVIYRRAGDWSLSSLVGTADFAAGPALLILSSIAPAVAGIHSGALSGMRLTGLSQGTAAGLVCAFAMLLGALRLDLSLLGFLSVLGALAPPAALVMLLHQSDLSPEKALGAWGAGAGISVALLVAGTGGHVAAGMGVSAALTFVLRRWSLHQEIDPSSTHSSGP